MKNLVRLEDRASLQIQSVGGKFVGLARLNRLGIRVPPAFAVSCEPFRQTVDCSGLCELIRELDELSAHWIRSTRSQARATSSCKPEQKVTRTAAKIRQQIEQQTLHSQLVQAVFEECDRMGGQYFAVRSSATFEDQAEASSAGAHDTLLYQRKDDVPAAVVKCWRSLFSDRAIDYRNRQWAHVSEVASERFPGHHSVAMGVVIQVMVNASVSGVGFSVDRETGWPGISLNATFGLGELIVSGQVTPDRWLVTPNAKTLIQRRLGTKRQERVWNGKSIEDRAVPESRQQILALDSLQVSEVAKTIAAIADQFQESEGHRCLDVEFAFDQNEQLHILQARTLHQPMVGYDATVSPQAAQSSSLILEGGITGAPGCASGLVRVARSFEEADRKIRGGDILVCKATTNIWEPVMMRAKAVVTDEGDEGAHAALFMSELGRPSIVGTSRGTTLLADWEEQPVTIEAGAARVWKGILEVIQSDGREFTRESEAEWDDETRKRSWQAATNATQTREANGRRWLGKPNYAVGKLQADVHVQAHQWIARELGCQIRYGIHDGIHEVDFDDWWQIRERLRAMPLAELEQLQARRRRVTASLQELCRTPAEIELERVIDLYVQMNGFMAIAYDLYKVSQGWLRKEFLRLDVPAVYRQRIRLAAIRNQKSEAAMRAAAWRLLLESFRRDSAEPFVNRLAEYAATFKVTPRSDLRDEPFARMGFVLDRLQQDSKLPTEGPASTVGIPVEYYPDDRQFQRVLKLAAACWLDRENAHHQKARCEHPIRGLLLDLGQRFGSAGMIPRPETVFDITVDELLTLHRCLDPGGKQG